jgi:hypothetical protein
MFDPLRMAVAELQAELILTGVMADDPTATVGDVRKGSWVDQLGDQLLAKLRDGQLLSCPHVADPLQQTTISAAWRLDLLTCVNCCVEAFALTGVEDRLCDRCGVDAGEQNTHQGVLQVGPILVMYGVCGACYEPLRQEAAGR